MHNNLQDTIRFLNVSFTVGCFDNMYILIHFDVSKCAYYQNADNKTDI